MSGAAVTSAPRWSPRRGLEALDEALDRPAGPTPAPLVRLRQLAVCLLLTALAFAQSPGTLSGDTKLDLTQDPAGWLGSGLRVWSTDGLGSLQNQAYGYLFPMGPFHLGGLAAGLPPWVVQRLWWSVLLVAAFLGVVRLAGRLGVGTPGVRALAGLAYALSPRVLTELGGLSSELMPLAALPWVLVPLVGTAATARPRTAAARSGVALLCAGAVNAAATLAVLPLAALWLLPGLRDRAGRRLAAWWVLAVALASSWWVVPLLVQGAFSPPFLDYIETAATTTLVTSPVEVLRGTTHWLAYLAVGGEPWWRAGWTLVTSPVLILDTAVVAALGVAGLSCRSMPFRGRLVSGALLGLVLMAVAHDGALTSPVAESARSLLDGALAPFRNVHKFDPVLRLPLALGLCHVLTVLAQVRPRRQLAFLAGVALLGTATPALVNQLVPAGPFAEVPSYWQEAADWVDERAGTSSTLLVPGAADAEHLWGRPLDEPLQVLAHSPVVVRDAVPLGGPEVTRLLDAVGARLDTGRGSTGLATVLSRAGIRHVVVRNDLDRQRTGAPRPVLVAQALQESPGLRRVRGFGPLVGNDVVRDGLVGDRGLDQRRPAVEVYEVVDAPDSPVAVYPRSGAWRLDGGPEALLQLADRGLLTAGDAVVRVGDGDAGADPRTAVSDGLRRRTYDFGRVRDNASVTLTAAEPDTGRLPGVGSDRLVVARWTGVEEVTASSSAADPGAVLLRRADQQPVSAVDGDADTAWVSASLNGPIGQWLELDLAEPTDLRGATIALAGPELSPQIARVTEVQVRTDAGTARTRLLPGTRVQDLAVPAGRTGRVRVIVTDVDETAGFGRLVGIRELVLPGVEVGRTIVLPATPEQDDAAVYLLDDPVGARDGCVRVRSVRCSPELVRGGEEPGGLDRVVQLPEAARLEVSGGVRPAPSPVLDARLDAGAAVQVTASSRAVADPRGRPSVVADGDLGTAWTAAARDEQPSLLLRWDEPRRVDRIELRIGRQAVARALRVSIETPEGRVERAVPPDGRVRFPAVTTQSLRLRVLAAEDVVDVGTAGQLSALPVGFAEVSVPGLGALLPVESDPDEPVSIGCGQGPQLAVGDTAVETRALGTRADLMSLRPLLLAACTPDGRIAMDEGENRISATPRSGLDVTSLTLGPAVAQPDVPAREAEVLSWGAEERTVRVGPGESAWLAVRENRNAGWQATLDGQALEPVRLDGWQQAFVLPAGAGGEVRLVYRPGTLHRAGLAAGSAGVLVLLLLALVRVRRPGSAAPVAAPVRPSRLRAAAPLVPAVLLVLLGGAAGAAAWAVAALVGARFSRWLPLLAGAATVAAGAVVAWSPWSGAREPGALSTAAQVPALLAVALLAVSAAGSMAALRPRGSPVSAGRSAASAAGPAPPPPAG